MSSHREIQLSNNSIEIHLAGPGYGEGVLIVIGNEIAIGIDCCPSLVQLKDGERSHLDKRLAQMPDHSRLYWLITHFHLDHFNSFNTVLDLYEDKLESIVVPTAYTEGDHYFDMLYQEMKEDTGLRMAGHIAIDQLNRLKESLARDSLKFKIMQNGARVPWIHTTLLTPDNQRIPLSVDYYGVSVQLLRQLRGESLTKAFKHKAETESGGPTVAKKDMRPYATANEGSYILHVRVGRFEGLFLGDAESKRTEEILTRRGRTDAEVIYLKVAHHGSDDGTTKVLLEKLCDTESSKSERHAIIAPYQNRLPLPAVINMLVNGGFDVKTSGAKFADSRVMGNILKECSPLFDAEVIGAIAIGADVITSRVEL